MFAINISNSFFTYPFFYSNDGAAYLSSARSIFTKDAFIAYEWIREPIYPLFLKYVNELLGQSGNYVILLQSIFLVLSIFIVAKIYEKYIAPQNINYFWFTVGVISIFSQIYFQYSAMILQQSIFTLLISLYVWLLSKSQNLSKFIIFYVLLIFVSVNTSILFYYFNFLFILSLFLIQIKNFSQNKIKLITFLLSIITLIIINFLSIKPWEFYKQETFIKNNIIISLEKPEKEGDTVFTDKKGQTRKAKIQAPSITQTFIKDKFSEQAIKSLRELFFSSKDKSENYTFFNTLLQDNFDCGGNIAQGALNFTKYSQFYFLYSCKNGFLRNYVHLNLSNFYFYVYISMMGLFLILSVKEIFVRKINFSLIVVPFLFVFLYFVLLFNVDRYVIPIYPFTIAIVSYNIINLLNYFKNGYSVQRN